MLAQRGHAPHPCRRVRQVVRRDQRRNPAGRRIHDRGAKRRDGKHPPLVTQVVAERGFGHEDPVRVARFVDDLAGQPVQVEIVSKSEVDQRRLRWVGVRSLPSGLGDVEGRFQRRQRRYAAGKTRLHPFADQFRTKWEQLQSPQMYGPLQSMTWNGVLPQYEKVEGGNVLMGVIYAAIKFHDSEGRFTFIFRRAAEGWQLDELPELFPRERARRGA